MYVYRITRVKWAETFSGSGVAARWNLAGKRMLYTSSSIALALLEILVHIRRDQIPEDYVWLRADIPDKIEPDVVEHIPADPAQYGTSWLETSGRKVILMVPSVIVPEKNFLLNPDHTDFSKIRWGTYQALEIDPRLTQAQAAAFTPRGIGSASPSIE